MKPHIVGLLILVVGSTSLQAQQVSVGRIEQMPNMPSPYLMRDWRSVAIGYDEFVYDLQKTGQYLPLIWINSSTVNYPDHDSFGLETVVGTPRYRSGEAINVLPSIIGATLAGIDKSDQDGFNWVQMAEEFFNRRPAENVYLNGPVASSGNDWWYETMPNVFFYQLFDLYPGTGDFDYQFRTVADQFLAAVKKMGGKATPWSVPHMDYRAWAFSTMKPTVTGVREPEAAGAIAWLLYSAYTDTGEEQYLRGAEWAMEFLAGRTSNPSYELQLPYGVYAAARMNAELGTSYDIEKLVNWCFDVGPLRSWGSLLGNWGGYDIHGLIGEDSANDYAFMMNGYQQAAALVPMTRYDDRFARAIGKWVLNLANASRLYYPNYLPPENQDSEAWAFQYDPNSYIGHEAIRQRQSGQSPFATGDAISGGWGYTNLVLYGSSHVGMLGGILDTTDVRGILRLDALKTDFFRAAAYPTYLYYNPYNAETDVALDLGSDVFDLYDAASNEFVAVGATGQTTLSLPVDAARLIVLTPPGGTVTYDGVRMLVGGIVVDYNDGGDPGNRPPRIKALDSLPRDVFRGENATLFCTAVDPDGDALDYTWNATSGTIDGVGESVTWAPPDSSGDYDVGCTVDDGKDGLAEATIRLTVFDNHAPVIHSVTAEPDIVSTSGSSTITCEATDADDDPLDYGWMVDEGSITGTGPMVTWDAPGPPGFYDVKCIVEDALGASASDSVGIVAGDQVIHLPFSGNPQDESGFDNHAIVHGAVLAPDRVGNPESAYRFDGDDDHLIVPSHPSLDFRNAMTTALWMTPVGLDDREAFLVSHGSWQNRWKLSIIPDHRLRWTINTGREIKDLDSEVVVRDDVVYHVAATYDGSVMRIFVDGSLSAEVPFDGEIAMTTLDLTIGQMVPGNSEWNFSGVIDEVQIYNRALSDEEVAELAGVATAITEDELPLSTGLRSSFPNPFISSTTIEYELSHPGQVTIDVFDAAGRLLSHLHAGEETTGRRRITWDGRDRKARRIASGVYFLRFESGGVVQYLKLVRL